MKCYICPRECGADRDNGKVGACGVDNKLYVARTSLHMWEEPCISGEKGSGTVFFAGCPLGCIYCQNSLISKEYDKTKSLIQKCQQNNWEYSVDDLANAFIELQDIGAENINLVTPTHYSLKIREALLMAKEKGLRLPVVYNCSGYEKVETLKMMEDVVDIYLTDFKYFDDSIAKEYSNVNNYVEIAKAALDEMVRQKPSCEFDADMMKQGVIVRNLLLPGHVNNSKKVIEYVYSKYGDKVYISIMNQYTPMHSIDIMKPLDRNVTKREYERLIDYALYLGINNAYIQEGDVASESFIPDFEKKN